MINANLSPAIYIWHKAIDNLIKNNGTKKW